MFLKTYLALSDFLSMNSSRHYMKIANWCFYLWGWRSLIKSSNRLALNTTRLVIFHFKKYGQEKTCNTCIETFLPVTYCDKYMRGSGDFVCVVVSIAKIAVCV